MLKEDEDRVAAALKELRLARELYCAGLPSYPSNFTRDGFTYALIAQNYAALENQVNYCSELQGRNPDPLTGEEPGKIHHEHPGIKFRNRITTYNACDSTALYLLGVCALAKSQHNTDAFTLHAISVHDAITYIESHVVDGIFYENPIYAGADDFALRVTYWKDSVINSPDERTRYPIVYTLAHFQNALALYETGKMLKDASLVEFASQMFHKGIERLWNTDHFVTAIDAQGTIIDPLSTDSLQSLLYLPKELLPESYAQLIQNYSIPLETQAGYRTGIPEANISDTYHTNYVWSHEQALIHCAARYHNLSHAQEVTLRILNYLDDKFPELVDAQDFTPAGNPLQLWAIGGYEYLAGLHDQTHNPFISHSLA